jgi:hypothetical protein
MKGFDVTRVSAAYHAGCRARLNRQIKDILYHLYHLGDRNQGEKSPPSRLFDNFASGWNNVLMFITRGFVLAVGVVFVVGEPAFEVWCARTQPPLTTRHPTWCFGSDCQRVEENFPWHTHSESDSETPSTVVSISASGTNSPNVAARIYASSYNFNGSHWSRLISSPPANPTEAYQQLPATLSSVAKALSSRSFGKAKADSRPFYSGIAPATRSQSPRIDLAQRMGASSRFGQRGFAPHLPRSV